MHIAVDAMGGDVAPRNLVDGGLVAARHLGVGLTLGGVAADLRRERERHDVKGLDLRIIDAPDVVGMEESPSAALRRKPRASIWVAADTVARGEAAACFSAGNTGAASAGGACASRVIGVRIAPAVHGPRQPVSPYDRVRVSRARIPTSRHGKGLSRGVPGVPGDVR